MTMDKNRHQGKNTARDAARRAARRVFRKSPCGRPPIKVKNVKASYDRVEGARHQRIRMVVKWNEVNEDTSSFRIKLKGYQLDVDSSPNGVDWTNMRRHSVTEKNAGSNADLALTSASTPNTTQFQFEFTSAHGLESGDSLRIRDVSDPAVGPTLLVYNGDWTVSSVTNSTTVRVAHGLGSLTLSTVTNDGVGKGLKDNDRAHYIVKNINKDLAYRVRVRALGRDGCEGEWSDFKTLSTPGDDPPPSPTNVKIHGRKKRHHRKIRITWDAVTKADQDLFDDRINHFGCEISQYQNFSTIFARDRMIKAQHKTFDIDPDDLEDSPGVGKKWYARVWSVGPDGDKSAKIPATRAGNSSSGATAEDEEAHDGAEPGTIRKFGKSTTPKGGWLKCDGTGYSTTLYSDLYGEIGYTYGGSGGTFNVPDARKRHWRGVGSGQSLGDNEGLAEGSRDEDHATHTQGTHGNHRDHRHKHKHKHHHRHKHDDHADASGLSGGAHQHAAGGIATQNGGFSYNKSTVQGTGGATVGGTHEHSITGNTGGQTSPHTHTFKGQYGTDGTKHQEDANDDEKSYSVSTAFDGSLTGGGDGEGSWSADPADIYGNSRTVDEDSSGPGHLTHPRPADDDGNRGHKKHPHLRAHYYIKT